VIGVQKYDFSLNGHIRCFSYPFVAQYVRKSGKDTFVLIDALQKRIPILPWLFSVNLTYGFVRSAGVPQRLS